MTTIRVLIADDHPEMLSALVTAVEADARFVVAATATSGEQAARLAAELPLDLALIDVRMPGGGPAAATAIASLPGAPVVVAISAETGVSTVAAMVEAGAVGYLAKGRIGEALPELLARCVHGEVVLATPTGAGALRAVLGARRAEAVDAVTRAAV
ncbi:response regulator [Oryzihumus leptocrescens]|uniref:Response regulator receiver domain-containing protein n=1 Tax=Oryzihumus leptocrescens TaxID=297536 RepID=A0A542Z9A5_9MICO|nr:response regulator [Oryzihumus leptocrescens]TQL56882.1 response regulator receiver domain-containing protein [Oryzihumus leptocrescens]